MTLPKDLKKTTSVTLTVTARATGVAAKPATTSVKYVVPVVTTPKPTPSPGPTLSPSVDSGRLDGGKAKAKGGGSGTSGSGKKTGGSGASGSSGGGVYEPPSPNATFDPPGSRDSGVSMPSISAPSPSVAPGALQATPTSRLRNNKAPVAQDLTFERMASTQVAWLAALLVAFSLLLTQLRLGRRNPANTAAAAAARRAKGTHRRSRRGMFGK